MKSLARITRSAWIQGLSLYLICAVVLGIIIFATSGFVGTDDYYHARAAALILEQKRLALDFPWLPQTLLNPERFVDHHLLFHLYLVPWVMFDTLVGAKLAVVSIAAGVFVAAWALLRQLNVQHAFLWSLTLFGLSAPFLHRMLMIRTQGAALLLLILALGVMFSARYRWLIVFGFAYAWLFDGFILLPVVAGLYALATWIADRKLALKPLAYTLLGVILGLIINPYFPQNLLFIAEHLGAKVDFASGVRVGNEWYPYDTGILLGNSTGALLALAAAFLLPSFTGRRRDRFETTLLFVALLTLFMLLRSRRFIEYFPAFALLVCAAGWGRLDTSLAEWIPLPIGRLRVSRWLIGIGSLLIIGFLSARTVTETYRSAQTAPSPEYMAGAAAWLRDNTPPGTNVFQTDWDDFTRLFYHNTASIYLVGLDPTYLQRANPALWDQWVEITQGRVSQPSQPIQTAFNAAYVVSDTRHNAFEDQVRDDPNMQLVYQDEFSYVWQISPVTLTDEDR